MKERDNIQNLFSGKLENHASPVRPEVWNGLQAKMAAAGVTSVVATKGLSALAKWLIGTAAVTGTAVVTTVVMLNSNNQPATKTAVTAQQAKTGQTIRNTETPGQESVSATQTGNPVTGKMTSTGTTPKSNQETIRTAVTGTGGMFNPAPVQPVTPKQDAIPANPVPPPVETKSSKDESSPATPVSPEKDKKSDKPVFVTENDRVNEESAAKITRIPNIFTPNGDRQNDYFLLESQNLVNFTITIMDKQNHVVFKSSDPDFQWDGSMMDGNPAPEGTYTLFIAAEDSNGKRIAKNSLLEIKR